MRTPERKTLIVALSAVVAASVFGLGPFAVPGFGGKGPSIVDFSQCANGKTPSTSTECPDGWINGILHDPNSHYSEGQVVPQRLVVAIPAGSPATGRTITIEYQARKGDTHAYDSLATWNHTQSTAQACDGLTAGECPVGTAATFAIPDDPTAVLPATLNGAGTTAHMLSGAARRMTMVGGTITGVSAPAHDNAAGKGDDFASIEVTYDVPDTAADRNVMLLFGGHLAAALGANGWGPGLGASSISGGPYHIRVAAIDGESVGRRDNQIQGAAIFNPSISTIPVPDHGAVGVAIHDTAQLSGGSPSPGGTVTFTLFPPSDPQCDGSPVFTSTNAVSNGQATSGNYTTSAVGVYHWVAEYSGGEADAPATHACGEPVTIGRAGTAITTTPVPSHTTVGAEIHDTATVTGGFSPAGTVHFELFGPDDPTCDGTPVYADDASLSGAHASSGDYTVTEAGTYQWVAHYEGDSNNGDADGACGDEPVTVGKASPQIATVPVPASAKLGDAIHDTATVSGGYNPSGTVTFRLYAPADATCSGTPVYTETVALGGDGTAVSGSYTTTSAGTYRWIATYDGDDDNNTDVGGCDDEQVSVTRVLGRRTIVTKTTGTTGGSRQSGGKLPTTGANVIPLGVAGLSLVLLGAVMSWAPRKRRQRAGEI